MRTKRTGKVAETALLTGDIQEAFCFLQCWYREVTKAAPKPCFQTVERQTRDHKQLYRYVPSPGDLIPVNVDPGGVEDGRPHDPEICEKVHGLSNKRAGGTWCIRAEGLKRWLTECEAEERRLAEGGAPLGKDKLDPIVLWEVIVLLIQTI